MDPQEIRGEGQGGPLVANLDSFWALEDHFVILGATALERLRTTALLGFRTTPCFRMWEQYYMSYLNTSVYHTVY